MSVRGFSVVVIGGTILVGQNPFGDSMKCEKTTVHRSRQRSSPNCTGMS